MVKLLTISTCWHTFRPVGAIHPGTGSMLPNQQPAATGAASGFPDVDMSHLSEEERILIENVMAKAQIDDPEITMRLVSNQQCKI